MRFSDEVIASYLNDEWRTPPAVHRLLGSGAVADIAYALERLARAGKIEAKHEAAMTGRAGPPVLCIDYYRKLQKWPKSSSVDKLPTSPTVTGTRGRQQPARKKPAPPPPPDHGDFAGRSARPRQGQRSCAPVLRKSDVQYLSRIGRQTTQADAVDGNQRRPSYEFLA